MELIDLGDLPAYTSSRRPFDWYLDEPPATQKPESYIYSLTEDEAYADLKLCLFLYMANRRDMYINYMAGAKNLFAIFFGDGNTQLREKAACWTDGLTEWINKYSWRDFEAKGNRDWTPAYEIQRLWIATGIHWSWLELAWYECEYAIWKSGNSYLIEKLERARPL